MDQTAVIVLGMHRSGTSLISGILDKIGVDFGTDLLTPMNGINDKGFWESRRIVEANEKLLNDFGLAWYSVRGFPEGWLDSDKVDAYKKNIKKIIKEEFGESSLWGVKDPRLCLLLPIWIDVLDSLGVSVRYVMVHREPIEIAMSLFRRDKIPPMMSLALTGKYLASLESIELEPIAHINMTEVMRDWVGCFSRISEQLDLSLSVLDKQEEVRNLISPELIHFNITTTSLLTLLDWMKVQAKEGRYKELPVSIMDVIEPIVVQWKSNHDDYIYTQDVVSEKDKQLAQLGQEFSHTQDVVSERDKQLAEVNQQLAQLGQEFSHAQDVVAERDKQLAEVNQQLAQLGQEFSHAQNVVAERDEQLQTLITLLRKSWFGRLILRKWWNATE